MTKIDQRAFIMPPMVVGVSSVAGPQSAPSPWLRNGDHITYRGGVVVGYPVGGNMGDGMVNAGGYFVNGQPISGGGTDPNAIIDAGTY